MSLPLFLVDALPMGEEFELGGAEGRHAATVQRLRAGEELILADGKGGMAHARVKAVAGSSLLLSLISSGYSQRPEPVLTVAQGIPKGDRGELAVQAMTEVGVDEILPWAATRSVTQWRGERGEKARAKWAATAREAAKQARRAWVPLVGGEPDLSTKALAKRLDANSLILHEEATEKLSTVELPAAGEIVIVVGPEGGIDDAELAAFQAAGARAVRLGESVLRTSTAGVAALSVLAVRLGRW